MFCTRKMEGKKSTSDKKEKLARKISDSDKKGKKAGAQRKNAVATGPLDLSSLNVPLAYSKDDECGLRRSNSEGKKCIGRKYLGEGAIPKIRPHTERLKRKFKSTPNKPDLESLSYRSCKISDSRTEARKSKTTEAKPESPTNTKEELIVAVDVVRKISRGDKEIHIHEEVDIRKQTRIPNSDSNETIYETVERRSKSETVNPMSLLLKGVGNEGVKKEGESVTIKSTSEEFVDKLMLDMYKKIDLEHFLHVDPFESQLDMSEDGIYRSSSFGVANDYNLCDKSNKWFSKPVFKQSFSSEETLNDQVKNNFEELIKTRREVLVKQKRQTFKQRSASDKGRKNSNSDKAKRLAGKSSHGKGFDTFRRKSKSEELIQETNKEFLHVLQQGAGQSMYHEDGICSGSSSEEILTTCTKTEKSQKVGKKLFAQKSMNSIEENVETPPGSPVTGIGKDCLFQDKLKNEKKRKISTGKKIIDKIKNEIVRKTSSGEKAPNGEKWHDKIKREKSFEKLKNKKREIDRKFQKWIEYVICLHVSIISVHLLKKKTWDYN